MSVVLLMLLLHLISSLDKTSAHNEHVSTANKLEQCKCIFDKTAQSLAVAIKT